CPPGSWGKGPKVFWGGGMDGRPPAPGGGRPVPPAQRRARHGFRGVPPPPVFDFDALPDGALLNEYETAALAMRFLPSARIQRFRLELATKPYDVFFLCQEPSQNLDHAYNASNLKACEQAKTFWTQATSRRGEGVEAYKVTFTRDDNPFPEPKWPSQSLAELIEKTFAGRMINSEDHPGPAPDRGAAIAVSKNFGTIVVADFEYEVQPGELPTPLCMGAHVLDETLRHVRTIRMWREELLASTRPPFDTGPDTLFVAYSAWAELTCLVVLGWPFPTHIFDLHTAYLATTNILLPYNPDEVRNKPRKRLPDACRAYGIGGWEKIDKNIAEDIGNGRWQPYGQERVFVYCEEVVRMSVRLLRAQLRRHQCGPTILP